jgi:hypothetical protein
MPHSDPFIFGNHPASGLVWLLLALAAGTDCACLRVAGDVVRS